MKNMLNPLVPPGGPLSDMSAKPLPVGGAHVGAIGLKGPWSLNPGNPDFPNHRPYLTNVKPPMDMAPAPSQKLKMT